MTYLALTPRYGLLATSENPQTLADDFAASIATEGTWIVDLNMTDVATIANMAQADYPRLAEKGTGFLGAGTHPAQPYLETMLGMHDVGKPGGFAVDDIRFGMDDARRIIITFLSNAGQWRGETARIGKARLRAILEAKR